MVPICAQDVQGLNSKSLECEMSGHKFGMEAWCRNFLVNGRDSSHGEAISEMVIDFYSW